MSLAYERLSNPVLMEKIRNKYSVVTNGLFDGVRADTIMLLLDTITDRLADVPSEDTRTGTYALSIAMRVFRGIEPADWWLANMDRVADEIMYESSAVAPALEKDLKRPGDMLDSQTEVIACLADNLVTKWTMEMAA